MKKIVFVGPFGDSNFGDYAMLINNIYDINHNDIMIFTYNKDLIAKTTEFYLNKYNVDVVEVKSAAVPEIKTGKKFTIEYDNFPYTPIEILSKVLNYDELVKKISLIDTLVVSGGGFLNHLWNAKHRQYKLFDIMAVVLIANQLNKKIVFLGNTYGPFDDSFEFFKYFFGRLQNVVYATRDNMCSLLNMNSIGVNKGIDVIPDDLYFVNEQLKSQPEATNKYGDYIILELYESIDYLERNQNLIKNFVNDVKNKYNLDVLFLPLDKEYGGQYQGEFLRSVGCNIQLYDLKHGFLPVEEAHNIIKFAKFVICHRYHMFVLSIANNIPVVQILKTVCGDKRYYYNKSVGMLNSVLSEQIWSESLFFELNIEAALNNVLENLDNITSSQNQLFNDKKIEAEKILYNKRKNYIDKYILQ